MMVRRRESVAETEDANLPRLGNRSRLHSSYPDQALGRDIYYLVRRVPLGLMLMFGAGLISALLGIGSGVLKIPAMDTALRLPIKVSSATSNFMIGRDSGGQRGTTYFARGDIDPAIAGPVALGSFSARCSGRGSLWRCPAKGSARLRCGVDCPGGADAVFRHHRSCRSSRDMSPDLARHPRLEGLLAGVLRHGTWLATGVIALGAGLSLIGLAGFQVVCEYDKRSNCHPCVALFILLPVVRVLLMMIVFVRDRDYCFGVIATLGWRSSCSAPR